MKDDRGKRPLERVGTGMVGPLHRQVDDAAVKPSPSARRITVEFPAPDQAAEAHSALAQVGHVITTGSPNTFELTVDQDGIERVRKIAARHQGRIHMGH